MGISQTVGGTSADPEETPSFDVLDTRSSDQMVHSFLHEVDKPKSTSNFDLRYRKFTEVVNLFMDRGNYFPKPEKFVDQMIKSKTFGSYAEFEDWVLFKPSQPIGLNFFHPEWITDPYDQDRLFKKMSKSEKERLESWLDIFLSFERFSIIRPQVSINLYRA